MQIYARTIGLFCTLLHVAKTKIMVYLYYKVYAI